VTASGQVLKELEDWLHNLPGTSVDIVRLAGLVGPAAIRDVFCRKVGAGRPAWRQSCAS
jgi:hypothetical protein